jgi:hypothetical protein
VLALLVAALVGIGLAAAAQAEACRGLRIDLRVTAFLDGKPSARGAGVSDGTSVRLEARVRGGQLPPGARIIILRARLDRFGRVIRGTAGALPRLTLPLPDLDGRILDLRVSDQPRRRRRLLESVASVPYR